MIKVAIKKFFSNLKYYFTPLGILLIFLLLGLLATIAGLKDGINIIVEGIKEVKTDAGSAISVFTQEIGNSIKLLFTKDFNTIVNGLTSEEGLKEVFGEAMNVAVGEIESYGNILTTALFNAVEKIGFGLLVFAFDITIGILISFYFTKYLIRHNMVKRTFLETLKSFGLGFVLLAIELVIIGLLMKLFSKYAFIYIILGIIIFAIGSLSKAYLVQRKKGMRFKEVVNVKNVLMLYLADLIVLLISVAFGALVFLLTRNIVGVFLAIPFVELAFIHISLMSESYVSSVINNDNYNNKKEELAIE